MAKSNSNKNLQLSFYEKRASGFSDKVCTIDVNPNNLKPYSLPSCEYNTQFSKAVKKTENLGEIGDAIPTVSFTARTYDNYEDVNLYWIKKMGCWVGISKYITREHDHSDPLSEVHNGPYRVEGILAQKLLEAYGLDEQCIERGIDIAKISPKKLEILRKKQKRYR
ncbi:MAG: hypothetical protein QXP39_00420 [Candidatus Aenigmatarchaeota archaeon]